MMTIRMFVIALSLFIGLFGCAAPRASTVGPNVFVRGSDGILYSPNDRDISQRGVYRKRPSFFELYHDPRTFQSRTGSWRGYGLDGRYRIQKYRSYNRDPIFRGSINVR